MIGYDMGRGMDTRPFFTSFWMLLILVGVAGFGVKGYWDLQQEYTSLKDTCQVTETNLEQSRLENTALTADIDACQAQNGQLQASLTAWQQSQTTLSSELQACRQTLNLTGASAAAWTVPAQTQVQPAGWPVIGLIALGSGGMCSLLTLSLSRGRRPPAPPDYPLLPARRDERAYYHQIVLRRRGKA